MAVEAKRGCGFRKVGGLYLVDDGAGSPCCKMPLKLTICPCCGAGIKQARGWTWVDCAKLFARGNCTMGPISQASCPAANPARMGRAGLIWIGESFYPTPADFLAEASKIGISRRLSNVPRDYKPGETWVLFAHPKAIEEVRLVELTERDGMTVWHITLPSGEPIVEEGVFTVHEDALRRAAELDLKDPIFAPGVIRIAKPRGFEKIVKQSEFDAVSADRASWEANDSPDRSEESKSPLLKKFERDAARGIKWVPVPDDDKDHQGTVYDKPDEEDPA